jgi:MoaA/NifB/PqqE/SkfB family radical SAM enzyme
MPPGLITEANDPPETHRGAMLSTQSHSGRGRRRVGVRLREEPFGALAYVPDRDHFVALDRKAFHLLESGDTENRALTAELARAGVLDIPSVPERNFRSGRALIGDFPDLPDVTAPMVVNAFTTAFCPLRCGYCHAEDLMQPFRTGETDDDIDRVAMTAAAVPAMVAVVTGGDPILRPDRTERLIMALAPEKAIVIDTSGAGDITPLLPILKGVQGHLRVSVDSADATVHDRLRPINPRLLPRGTSSHAAAWTTIHRAVAADVATTVQTVISSANEDRGALIALARRLTDEGIRQWVLHVAVAAGRAAEPHNRRLLPRGDMSQLLADVLNEIETDPTLAGLRVRVTATHTSPNAVLLVGSRGDLYAETGPAGKVRITEATSDQDALRRLFHERIDRRAHTDRYLGGTDPQWA